MHESGFQQVVWWLVHMLMLAYYGQKLLSHWMISGDRVFRWLHTPFSILTPKNAPIPQPALTQSLGYLVAHERAPIIANALAINALGMALSTTFPSLLYLDMIGTAVTSLLLGPWYGAIVACLSSGFINYALFPSTQTLPWILVNVVGAFYWGAIASMPWFRRSDGGSGPWARFRTVFLGGFVCSLVLAIPGSITQLGLGLQFQDSLSFDPKIAVALNGLCTSFSQLLDQHFPALKTGQLGVTSLDLSITALNFVRYLPDKIITIVAAIMIIRTVYPMHWNLLVQNKPEHARVFLLPRQPFLFFTVFVGTIVLHHYFADVQAKGSVALTHPSRLGLASALIALMALIVWLIAESGEAVSTEEVRGTCVRAKAYQLIYDRTASVVTPRFDNGAALGILVGAIILGTGEVVVLQPAGDVRSQLLAISESFRQVSALVVGLIFLLRLAQTAAQQHRMLEELPIITSEAHKWVKEQAASVSSSNPMSGQVDAQPGFPGKSGTVPTEMPSLDTKSPSGGAQPPGRDLPPSASTRDMNPER
jgi:hypothetical protein